MTSYRAPVLDCLSSAFRKLFPELECSDDELDRLLEIPKEKSRGNLAFPCFQFAKQLRKAPPQIAAALADAMSSAEIIAKAEAVGPYLNLTLNHSLLASKIIPSIQAGEFTAPRPRNGRTSMLEYSQPNTHKVFHVGHCRNAALGDSLGRLVEWSGDKVILANYFGDEGTHVAGCLWYLKKFAPPLPDEHRGEFIGLCYENAYRMKDLRSYSKVGMVGATSARILSIQPHPRRKEWTVLQLDTKFGNRSVVTAGKGVKEGDLVFYGAPGLRLVGRMVEEKELEGVLSQGIVFSEKELSLSENNDQIALFPADQPNSLIGIEAADAFSTRRDIPSVVAHIAEIEKEISEVLQRLERHEGESEAFWRETSEYSYAEFRDIYRWLNCRFDHDYTESQFGAASKEIVLRYLEEGVFVRSEGAIGADLSADKLGFCILIKSDGTATYAARDLALSQQKFADYPIDRLLNVVDFAQTLHFNQVFRCLHLMGFPQASACKHIAYNLVVGPDGKMSSRKGNTVPFSQLKSNLRSIIESDFLEKYRGEWSDEEIERAKDYIARATIRYGMLKESLENDIVFDLKEWTARTGNTGPYLMYAYARTRSIIREVKDQLPDLDLSSTSIPWHLVADESEHEVIFFLAQYPDVVSSAADRIAPNELCAYLFDLSRSFSRMYERCSVVRAPDLETTLVRAQLVDAVGTVLQHGLSLLGIDTLERM